MWQPIETAPRDGVWFVASDPRYNFHAVVRYYPPNGTDGPYGPFIWGEREDFSGTFAERAFTHWMPLPLPPEE